MTATPLPPSTRRPRGAGRIRRRAIVGAALAVALMVAVASAPAGVAAPREGRFAYLVTGDAGFSYRLVTVDATGGGPVRVTSRRAVGRPAFSPDGSRIAFSGPLTDDSDGRYALFVVNSDGTGLRRLNRPRFAALDPAWSPDGRRLAFTIDRRGNFAASCCVLRVLRVSDGRGRDVARTARGSHPAWSPDGRHLAFAHPRGLRQVRVDTGRVRTLVAGAVRDPAWSPDGRQVAYVAALSPRRSAVRVVPASGGAPVTRVDRGGQVESPAWGADSRGIAYVAYRGQGEQARSGSAVWHSAGPGATPTLLFDPAREIRGLAWTASATPPGDRPVTGDWDGDGRDSAGLVTSVGGRLRWRLTNRHNPPATTVDVRYGSTRRFDQPVVGDWNGDGTTTIGVVRPVGADLQWRLSNRNDRPSADLVFRFGSANAYDVPVVGDFNGDGTTTVGVVRPVGDRLEWRLTDTHAAPRATRRFLFGSVAAGDVAVPGDWDGDGMTTAGVARLTADALIWRQTDHPAGAGTARTFRFGSSRVPDIPVTGDWNGRDGTSVGFVRAEAGALQWFLTNANAAGPRHQRFTYGWR